MAGKKAHGFIMIFTGNGKGKTTAALGAAFRALGHNFKVVMIQFIKGTWKYGELEAAKKFDNFSIVPMGRGFLNLDAEVPDPVDCALAEEIWDICDEKIMSDEYDIVICDEAIYALSYGVLSVDRVLETLARKPEWVNVILTGRGVPKELVEVADLVTEMREIKHPRQQWIKAQRGIEF